MTTVRTGSAIVKIMVFLHTIPTYPLRYIWHECVFCTQVKGLWHLSFKCYLWKNILSSRNKSYVAKFGFLSMPMIWGGKNGFFSVPSVLFHGMNSNWNIHFTITTTCTDRENSLVMEATIVSIIIDRTTKLKWKWPQNFDMFIYRTVSQ